MFLLDLALANLTKCSRRQRTHIPRLEFKIISSRPISWLVNNIVVGRENKQLIQGKTNRKKRSELILMLRKLQLDRPEVAKGLNCPSGIWLVPKNKMVASVGNYTKTSKY